MKTDDVKTSKVDLPEVSIYHNPANESITISNLKKEEEVVVTDYVGKVVLSVNSAGTLDISSLVPGLYFLNLTGYKPKRFVKYHLK